MLEKPVNLRENNEKKFELMKKSARKIFHRELLVKHLKG